MFEELSNRTGSRERLSCSIVLQLSTVLSQMSPNMVCMIHHQLLGFPGVDHCVGVVTRNGGFQGLERKNALILQLSTQPGSGRRLGSDNFSPSAVGYRYGRVSN